MEIKAVRMISISIKNNKVGFPSLYKTALQKYKLFGSSSFL